MNFEELDKKMRIYEQSIDQHILPDLYLVAQGWMAEAFPD